MAEYKPHDLTLYCPPGLGIEIDVGDLNKHHGHPTAELIAMQMIAMEGKQTGGKQTGSGLGVWG